jgi:hypothetical protein
MTLSSLTRAVDAADIPESYFEYKATFTEPIFFAWTLPNQVVVHVMPMLKDWGVELSDVSWNKDSNSFGDLQLTFNVRKLRAALRVSLETLTCIAMNPDWSEAPVLVELFERAVSVVRGLGITFRAHEHVLAMHVRQGDRDFKARIATLVNEQLLGPGEMYGVSVYREDGSSMAIDKSVRYEKAVFIRIYRTLPVGIPFVGIAKSLYDDEVAVLRLLGFDDTGSAKD